MKYKILLSFLLTSAVVLAVAFVPADKKLHTNAAVNNKNEAGIQFVEANWAKAIAEAKKQKKMIFIDAYTSWCGPCRMLKQKTFTDKAAGDFFNKHFINIALDMEKGDGIAFAQKYQVAAYPTLFIMDAEEKSVTTSEGYINPAQLIEFGKYVINKVPKIN
jgi:thioredoxin-related protein